MKNQGLKSYTKQLTQEIGNGALGYVNINKEAANLILNIPLFKSMEPNAIDLSLYFNYQNRNQMGDFGKGILANYQKKIVFLDSGFGVEHADGSIDAYQYQLGYYSYFNEETQTRLYEDESEEETTYRIEDKYNNTMYLEDRAGTGIEVFLANQEKIKYDASGINNFHNAKIEYERTGNLITKVTYKQDSITQGYYALEYDSSSRLVHIKAYRGQALLKELEIIYKTDQMLIVDSISKDCILYHFTDGRVHLIEYGFNQDFTNGRTISIAYEHTKTTVTNEHNLKHKYFFNNDLLPLYEMDSDDAIVTYKYDEKTKKLCANSSIFTPKNVSAIFNGNIKSFKHEAGLSMEKINENDADFMNTFSSSYRVNGTGVASYRNSTKCLASESITLLFIGKQNKEYSKKTNVEVVFSVGNQSVRKECFKKQVLDNLYEVDSIGLTCKEASDKIEVTFYFYGDASIDFGCIQIIKKGHGVVFQYDEKGNLIQSLSQAGSNETNYNQENLPVMSIGVDSTSYDYKYDKKGNLTQAKTGFSTVVNNTYDAHNNLTVQEIVNGQKNKILSTRRSYTADGKFISSQFDELENETSYEYNQFGQIKKIVNALGAAMEYSYNEFDGLKNILLNQAVLATYTYDSMRRISSVTLANGSKYKFMYTDQYLTNIIINDVSIIQYEYDKKTGLIKSQSYNVIKKYFFTYNNKNQITTISTNEAAKINVLYRYEYNALNQLICVKDANGTILNKFEYNQDGQIILSSGTDFMTKYQYNQFSDVQQKAHYINKQYINASYHNLKYARGYCPEAIEGIYLNTRDVFGTMFNGTADLKNKEYYIKPVKSNQLTFSSLQNIPCLVLNRVCPLSYVIPFSNAHPLDSNCVGFWFYLSEQTKNTTCLFSLKNATTACGITVYLDMQNKLVLELTDKNANVEEVISTHSCKINDWNFFGLTWMNRQDERNNDVCEYALFLNDTYNLYKKQNPRLNIYFNSTDLYHIGHHYLSDGMDCLTGAITALMIGAKKYKTIEGMTEYYEHTKEYLFASLPTSGTILYTLKMNQDFDIFPLHNTVTSLRGTKPTAYSVRSVSLKDKNRSFVYDKELKRYTFKADNLSRLEYSTSTTSTIMMRAKINKNLPKQYIFECKDPENDTIGLYRNSNNCLELEFNQKTYSTNLEFTSNVWHTVGISFMDDLIYYPDTIGIVKHIRIYLDGKTKTIQETTNKNSANLVTVSIGKKMTISKSGSNLGDVSTYYPLEGQIEMLAIRCTFCEVDTLNMLSEELKGISKVSEYDELGLLQKTSVHQLGKDIVSNTYTYKTRSDDEDYISTRLYQEQIKYNTNLVSRFFATDAIGNVTTILDSFFGNHHYEYNARGFLTKEEDTTYSYDNNGNILQAGSRTFEYDQTIKDKLISINGSEITYNGLNPKQWENNVYTFEGRRLTKLVDAVKINGRSRSISYTYNDQGLRTKKSINSNVTNYYYDGGKLITEINPTCRLDFLYDENGLLYGFIKDLTEYYFYVRDFMQNILGIVDKEGQLVVKYNYNAWGDHSVKDGNNKVNTSDTFIGNINPMRYKGYYYDKESKMYYCNSRYYVPQWCRWLNADHPSFLEIENINGMNLFSYCANNPVCILQRNQIMKLTGRQYDGIVVNPDISTETFITSEKTRQKASLANFVQMIHCTTYIIKNFDLSKFGNISITSTTQLNKASLFYSFVNSGNDGYSTGIGMNLGNWYGVNFYVSDIGFGSGWQLTPWLVGSSSWNAKDGISFSAGIILGDTTHEVTLSVGNGVLVGYALCLFVAAQPYLGARLVAGILACMIFISNKKNKGE